MSGKQEVTIFPQKEVTSLKKSFGIRETFMEIRVLKKNINSEG